MVLSAITALLEDAQEVARCRRDSGQPDQHKFYALQVMPDNTMANLAGASAGIAVVDGPGCSWQQAWPGPTNITGVSRQLAAAGVVPLVRSCT